MPIIKEFMEDDFKLLFCGSSDFVLPILENILENENKTILEVAQAQAKTLLISELPDTFGQIWMSLPSNFWSNPKLLKKIKLSAVLTKPDSLNRGKKVHTPVAKFSEQQKLNLIQPEKFSEANSELKNLGIDLGIVASYGKIIPDSSLKLLPFGWLNWHPSLLPKYRGPTPMQTAIYNGDKFTGLSWINLDKEMDAGNVYLQTILELNNNYSFTSLANYFGKIGAKTWAIVIALKLYEANYNFELAIPQNSDEVVFCKMLTKEQKLIDIYALKANEVLQHFLAFQVFPGTVFFSKYFSEEVKILSLKNNLLTLPENEVNFYHEFYLQKNKVFLICKNKSLVEIETIQLLNSGKRINLSGYNWN